MSASAAAESIMTTKRHFFTRIFPFWAVQAAAEAGFFPGKWGCPFAASSMNSSTDERVAQHDFAPEMCVVVRTEAVLGNSMIRFISSLQTYLNSL